MKTEQADDWNELGEGELPAALIGAKPPTKVRYTHDAMIDMIIANPGVSQNRLAIEFGYTPAWVSTIMSSDAFKARLANRREEIVDPALLMTVEEKFKAVTERSLAVLAEKLAQPVSQIPDNLALRAAELGAKAIGVGGHAPPPAVPADYLATLAERLVQLRSPAPIPITIEGECNEKS